MHYQRMNIININRVHAAIPTTAVPTIAVPTIAIPTTVIPTNRRFVFASQWQRGMCTPMPSVG